VARLSDSRMIFEFEAMNLNLNDTRTAIGKFAEHDSLRRSAVPMPGPPRSTAELENKRFELYRQFINEHLIHSSGPTLPDELLAAVTRF
jgi:hypothetical protein